MCVNGACACDHGFEGLSCTWQPIGLELARFKLQLAAGAAGTCPASTPVGCADGTCAVSVGKCSVDALTDAQRAAMPAREAELGTRTAVPLTASISGVSVDVTSNPAAAGKVIDGNDGSGGFWQSGMCPASGPCTQSATVDLTASQTVGALYIKASTWNDLIDTTSFEHSLDGVTWTLLDGTVPA